MADEDTLLGTSGKEVMPLEYQTKVQQLMRRRIAGQQMRMEGLKGANRTQMFGRHASIAQPLEHLAKAFQAYLGGKDESSADAEHAALMQQMGAEQAGDLSAVQRLQAGTPAQVKEQQGPVTQDMEPMGNFEVPAVKGDIAAAIARAQASKFGRIQGMGAQMAKDRQAMLMEQGKLLGAADPVRAIQHLQSGTPEAPVAPLTTPKPEFTTDPHGNPVAITTDAKGTKPTVTYPPKAATTTINNKLTSGADEDAAKYFNYGGKGFDKGVAANQGLQNTANLLDTLDKDPSMGAGANAFQFARKWAETLGLPVSDKTTPTEMVAMQLGQKTLDRLGGLGAQVSDADRKFMLETQGSLTNDPEAVRKMLLIEAKYLMQIQAQTSGQAGEVASRVSGMTLPQHTFSFKPSQRNADDLERLFTGQGFAPPAPAPKKEYAGRIRREKQ